jgi:hypothetical protein
MIRNRPHDRFISANIQIQIRNRGNEILVAAMSAKAAITHGFRPGAWEAAATKELAKFTDYTIVHRPKPSKHLPCAPIMDALRQSRAVVSHHSNVAVDAMICGTTVYTEKGIGTLISTAKLTDVATVQPTSYDTRLQFLADVAYCQWSPEEMRNGEVWQDVKSSVLRQFK